MGRAIDLFVTYRFIKLLVTPFEKTPAYKLGIIDKDGQRVMQKTVSRGMQPTQLKTDEEKSAYTVLHKLVFNIKKISENDDMIEKQSFFKLSTQYVLFKKTFNILKPLHIIMKFFLAFTLWIVVMFNCKHHDVLSSYFFIHYLILAVNLVEPSSFIS